MSRLGCVLPTGLVEHIDYIAWTKRLTRNALVMEAIKAAPDDILVAKVDRGRPKQYYPRPPTSTMSFIFDDKDVERRIRRLAKARKRTVSCLLRGIIEQYTFAPGAFNDLGKL